MSDIAKECMIGIGIACLLFILLGLPGIILAGYGHMIAASVLVGLDVLGCAALSSRDLWI